MEQQPENSSKLGQHEVDVRRKSVFSTGAAFWEDFIGAMSCELKLDRASTAWLEKLTSRVARQIARRPENISLETAADVLASMASELESDNGQILKRRQRNLKLHNYRP